MKKNDFTTLAVAIIVSALFSFLVSRAFISSPNDRKTQVEVVGPITTDFPAPNKKFFNEQSLNPTLLIEITPNNNPTPFQQSTQ